MPTDSSLQNFTHFLVSNRIDIVKALQARLEYQFELYWGDLASFLF